MKTVDLKTVCSVIMGQAPPGSSYNNDGVGLPLIAGAGDFGELTPKPSRHTTASSRCSQKGDIILCIRATIGDRNWSDGEYCLGRGVAVLRPHSGMLDSGYLWHWIGISADVMRQRARGSTFKQISKDAIETLKIPLPLKADGTPNLSEQRRIAAILDKADEVRRKRQEAIRLTEELHRSAFLDMFGDPVTKKWPILNIAKVAHPDRGSIRTGPFGSQLLHSEFVDEGVAVLGIDNAVANEFRWGERRFITESKYNQLKRYTVRPGDVLITIMGTCGRCAVVPHNIPVAINTKHLCCITLNQEICLPSYLHAYFLEHPIARQYLNKTAKGAIMAGLNMGLIKEMPIPIPPMDLQMDFAKFSTHVQAVKSSLKTAFEESETLLKSLSQRAFKGEL